MVCERLLGEFAAPDDGTVLAHSVPEVSHAGVVSALLTDVNALGEESSAAFCAMDADRTYPTLKAIVTALRTERESQDLTLEWIADKVGVSHVSVIGWESGQQRPTSERLRKWVGALGLAEDTIEQYKALQTIERVGWIPLARPFASGHQQPLAHDRCRCTALYRAAGTSSAGDGR